MREPADYSTITFNNFINCFLDMFWSHGRKTNGEGAPERDQVLPDQPVQSPNTCRQP